MNIDTEKPPAASTTGIRWDSYHPNRSADPHSRLTCALLAVLNSKNFTADPHGSIPYFETSRKRLWHVSFDHNNGLSTLLKTYRLDTVPGIARVRFTIGTTKAKLGLSDIEYSIYADVVAFGKDLELVFAVEGGSTHQLASFFWVNWDQGNDEEDWADWMGWDDIVAVIVGGSKLWFLDDGTDLSIQQVKERLRKNPNPLDHLGYVGFPGIDPDEPDDPDDST